MINVSKDKLQFATLFFPDPVRFLVTMCLVVSKSLSSSPILPPSPSLAVSFFLPGLHSTHRMRHILISVHPSFLVIATKGTHAAPHSRVGGASRGPGPAIPFTSPFPLTLIPAFCCEDYSQFFIITSKVKMPHVTHCLI